LRVAISSEQPEMKMARMASYGASCALQPEMGGSVRNENRAGLRHGAGGVASSLAKNNAPAAVAAAQRVARRWRGDWTSKRDHNMPASIWR